KVLADLRPERTPRFPGNAAAGRGRLLRRERSALLQFPSELASLEPQYTELCYYTNMDRSNRKTLGLGESLLTLAIVWVLLQTFLEDFSIVLGWSWPIRRVLVFTGLFFDVFFTVEFVLRYVAAVSQGTA